MSIFKKKIIANIITFIVILAPSFTFFSIPLDIKASNCTVHDATFSVPYVSGGQPAGWYKGEGKNPVTVTINTSGCVGKPLAVSITQHLNIAFDEDIDTINEIGVDVESNEQIVLNLAAGEEKCDMTVRPTDCNYYIRVYGTDNGTYSSRDHTDTYPNGLLQYNCPNHPCAILPSWTYYSRTPKVSFSDFMLINPTDSIPSFKIYLANTESNYDNGDKVHIGLYDKNPITDGSAHMIKSMGDLSIDDNTSIQTLLTSGASGLALNTAYFLYASIIKNGAETKKIQPFTTAATYGGATTMGQSISIFPTLLSATATPIEKTYIPIAGYGTTGGGLPGVTNSDCTDPGTHQPIPCIDVTQPNAFADYLNALIKITIGLCAVLAMIMIVYGGIEYMTSELVSGKAAGKERIINAIFGLLLALGAFTILNTLNPQLLDISLGQIGKIEDTPQAAVNGQYCANSGGPYPIGSTTNQNWVTIAGPVLPLPTDPGYNPALTTNHPGQDCTWVGEPACTSTRGLDMRVIKAIKDNCKTCDIVVNAGTECWAHSSGTSHKIGSPTVDLKPSPSLNRFLSGTENTVFDNKPYTTVPGVTCNAEPKNLTSVSTANHWHCH